MLRLQRRKERANRKLLLNRTAADCELNRRAKSFWMSAILAFLDNSTQHVCLWRRWKSNQPWKTPGESVAAWPADCDDCDDFYISVTVRVFFFANIRSRFTVYIYDNIQITKEYWGLRVKLRSHISPKDQQQADLNLFFYGHVQCRWSKSSIHIWFHATRLKIIWKTKKNVVRTESMDAKTKTMS